MTLSHVEQVRQRHEKRLLALEGVQAVGVGMKGAQPAITVYVDEAIAAVLTNIPKTLDGLPVIVEESGVFEAF